MSEKNPYEAPETLFDFPKTREHLPSCIRSIVEQCGLEPDDRETHKLYLELHSLWYRTVSREELPPEFFQSLKEHLLRRSISVAQMRDVSFDEVRRWIKDITREALHVALSPRETLHAYRTRPHVLRQIIGSMDDINLEVFYKNFFADHGYPIELLPPMPKRFQIPGTEIEAFLVMSREGEKVREEWGTYIIGNPINYGTGISLKKKGYNYHTGPYAEWLDNPELYYHNDAAIVAWEEKDGVYIFTLGPSHHTGPEKIIKTEERICFVKP